MAASSYSGTELIGVLGGTNTVIVSTKGLVWSYTIGPGKSSQPEKSAFQASVNTLPEDAPDETFARPAGWKKQ